MLLVPRLYRGLGQDKTSAAHREYFVHNRFTTWQFLADLCNTDLLPTDSHLTYLQLLAAAQHYAEFPGACGTELLDFSWSFEVAASFASLPRTGIGVIYQLYPGEIADLFLGEVREIELPPHFLRPAKQKAIFLRNALWVDLPGILDKFYFQQRDAASASYCGALDPLLQSDDDPVLQFARNWKPSSPPANFETHVRPLLERELILLTLSQDPHRAPWQWLDLFCEALFDAYRGQYFEAWHQLSQIQDEMIREAIKNDEKGEAVVVMVKMTVAECMADCGDIAGARGYLRDLLPLIKSPRNAAPVRGLLNGML